MQRRKKEKEKKMKKALESEKKTWIPAVVCVLEQVNSLYSRIAITSTLQQGCSWLELKAVWPDQTRGLFFLPFLLKCRYDQLPRCKHSYCFCSTFKNKFPHKNNPQNLPKKQSNPSSAILLFPIGFSRTPINQIMLKDN